MKNLVCLAVVGLCLQVAADAPRAQARNPYEVLAQRVETRLRFTTDVTFPGGPNLQVKVYDWLIGPRQEITGFPLEGFAVIEVKSGEFETTINEVRTARHQGEHFVVPEGARLNVTVRPEAGPGDNTVSLHGVVTIRR
jgi:hypothetical protein